MNAIQVMPPNLSWQFLLIIFLFFLESITFYKKTKSLNNIIDVIKTD